MEETRDQAVRSAISGEASGGLSRITPGAVMLKVMVMTRAAIILSVLCLFHPYIKLGGLLEAIHFLYLLALLLFRPMFLFLLGRKGDPHDRVSQLI